MTPYKNTMKHKSDRRFPVNPKDYKLYEEIGEGVSATVYRALCVPLNEIVAIKVLDLEKCNSDLDGIRREVQIMSLINHLNLLCAHCSFTIDHNLWVVMPYMGGGSCLHIMKLAYPEGFDEPVIATILREVLKALVYLHGHGHIHRDIKAGNILIDANGAVKLADFGVSACMFDTGDRQRTRNTFVGTPCWMAPEVLQQLHGYDFKADIWSFGITALELAHGHAPFSKYPPMKVLLMAVQSAPPGLDYERDRRFSKSFKELVAACLVKDPKKRPSSEKLLKHSFFKRARSTDYLVRSILDGLPPLGDRFRILKEKEMDILLQNQVGSGDKEQLSQQEYIRGVSGWNFNLEDLKAQAALIQTSDHVLHSGELDNNHKLKDTNDDTGLASQTERVDLVDTAKMLEDGREYITDLEGPFASAFPIRPLQALKTCFDVCEDDVNAISPDSKDSRQSNSECISPMQRASRLKEFETLECNEENIGRSSSVPQNINGLNRQKFSSGSLVPDHVLSPYKLVAADADRVDIHRRNQPERNPSGPLSYRQMRDPRGLTSAIHEESSEGRVVQHKGRFKVTSADANSKVAPLTNYLVSSTAGAPASSTVNLASVLPSVQFLLQQNATQREQLIKLIKCVEQTSGHQDDLCEAGPGDVLQLSQSSSRERELQACVVHLQQSVGKLAEELQRFKFKNAQLESQLANLVSKEGIRKANEAQG